MNLTQNHCTIKLWFSILIQMKRIGLDSSIPSSFKITLNHRNHVIHVNKTSKVRTLPGPSVAPGHQVAGSNPQWCTSQNPQSSFCRSASPTRPTVSLSAWTGQGTLVKILNSIIYYLLKTIT